MTIEEHLTMFAGRPVRDFAPDKENPIPPIPCVWRLRLDYDDKHDFADLLDRFLAEHGGEETTALVIGCWTATDLVDSEEAADTVQALVAARDRLAGLKALFFGDIIREECEISWIAPGDLSPLLAAFPGLEELRVRGASRLTFGRIAHPNLKVFAIESGGLPPSLLEEVWEADLPMLEHLELWLGDPGYGGIEEPDPLAPLLSGHLFPRLRTLGLRNCAIADTVAAALAQAPVLERLEVLDLSLGNLSDEGARALLTAPFVRDLKKLDIHHHYVSSEMVEQLRGLGIELDAGEPRKPHLYSDGTVYRYIVASE